MNFSFTKTVPLTIAVITSVAVVGFALGLTIPLVSLRLYAEGHSELLIGVMAAMPALGLILVAPLLRPLLTVFSMKQVLLACFAISASSILLLEASTSPMVWLPLRLIMGAATGIIIAIGESWINELVEDARRGRLIALYATIFTVCQFLGPSTLSLLGTHQAAPLYVATALHAIAAALFIAIKVDKGTAPNEEDSAPLSMLHFVRQAPAICGGVLFFSFFDSTVLSLLPIYAVQNGYTIAAAAFLASVVLGGDAFLQLPFGWLADHMNRRRLHRLCGFTTVVLAALIPLFITQTWILYPLLGLLGATAGAIYTVALIQIGQHYTGHDLVTANATSGVLWGIGSLIGPLLGGVVAGWGSQSLPIMLALAAAGFVSLTYVRSGKVVSTN